MLELFPNCKYQYEVLIKVTTFGSQDEEFEETGYSSSREARYVHAKDDEEARQKAVAMVNELNKHGSREPYEVYDSRSIISITRQNRIDP